MRQNVVITEGGKAGAALKTASKAWFSDLSRVEFARVQSVQRRNRYTPVSSVITSLAILQALFRVSHCGRTCSHSLLRFRLALKTGSRLANDLTFVIDGHIAHQADVQLKVADLWDSTACQPANRVFTAGA